MSKSPDLAKTVGGVFKDNPGTLRNVLVTLFVFALQAIITTEGLFRCPSKGSGPYGCMFIFLPALVLFLLSLLLSESFKNVAQGCCYTVDPRKQIVRKYFPCSRPRWCCSEEMARVFFYSFIASFLWIFWALLQKQYYTCVAVGFGSLTQIENLKNDTGVNKTVLKAQFEDAEKASQKYGFILLVVILGIPLLFLTVRRCCYQRPIDSIPSLEQYEKLESDAVKAKLKEKIENYAKNQGEGKAEKYFSQTIKAEKSASDIIRETHVDLSSIEGYSKILKSPDEYKKAEVSVVHEELKKKAEDLGRDRVSVTFKAKCWQEYEDDDPYDFVENVYEAISSEYPRVTGDQSQPYKKYKESGKRGDPSKHDKKYKQIDKREEVEMEERHDEA